MQHIKQLAVVAVALVATGALAACGNISHNIARDGGSAGQLLWPAPDDVTPIHEGGTWPSLASLRQIRSGMNKHQIKTLIGAPHFNEGVWGVREWDYLFHLPDPDTGKARVCQYKVLFDEDELARSFYWKPQSCAGLLNPQAKPAPVAVAAEGEDQQTTHTLDVLFAFDKSGFNDIRPEGRVRLSRLATSLKQDGARGSIIRINGYAGRIGSASYNQTLSQKRADTVSDYLVGQGIAADRITASGRGISAPIADCDKSPRAGLVACLAPNRRVEVVVKPQP